MTLPLNARWRLSCGGLASLKAARSAPEDAGEAFTLPGADALGEFSDLLGDGEAEAQSGARLPDAPAPDETETASIPFALPGALPEDASGPAALTREIDFGAQPGDRATLCFGMLCGRGEVLLGGKRVATFSGGPLEIDVTEALRRARRETLTLRFDIARPAGVFGWTLLRVSRHARLTDTHALPDAAAGAVDVRARVEALEDGEYALMAAVCAPDAQGATVRAALRAGEARELSLRVPASAPRFAPGDPYDMPTLRLTLSRGGAPCDEALLAFGFPGETPRFFAPLSKEDLRSPPDALAALLKEMHIPCVRADALVPEALLLHLSRAGVACRIPADGETRERLSRFPCAAFEAEETRAPELPDVEEARLLAAQDLCRMTAFPEDAPRGADARALLLEATGRALDPDAPDVRAVLSWLRAVRTRLTAEAARQGALSPAGALCLPGEWKQEDVAVALAAALAPRHLSAAPLYGAWWTQSRFSATMQAFLPEDEEGYTAQAALEDEEGTALAEKAFSCPKGGGRLGAFEARLPEKPGVLTLRLRLLDARGEIVEETAIPVYVGMRGPLESAF